MPNLNVPLFSAMLIAFCMPAMADITCEPKSYLPAGTTDCIDCPYEHYCMGGTFTPSDQDQGIQECPPADDSTRPTIFPDEMFPYDPVTGTYDRSGGITLKGFARKNWGNGGADIASCRAMLGFVTIASKEGHFEGFYYDPNTSKYEFNYLDAIYYSQANPGYYMDTAYSTSWCNGRHIYRRIVVCAAGYYCPGTDSPSCDTGSFYEHGRIECPAGSYCPPGASAPTPCPAGTYSGVGASECTPCPTGTYSGVGASECVPCTNAPENAVYTSGSDADNCPWKCDDGYAKNADAKCAPLCTAGVTRIRTPDLSIPLFASPQTAPSINVRAPGGVVCYGALVTGVGGLNIKIGDTIYHAVE